MRLLLLLSAFLTALSGALGASAASAQPVESSASITQAAKTGTAALAAAAIPAATSAAFGPSDHWQPIAAPSAPSQRASFGERRRE